MTALCSPPLHRGALGDEGGRRRLGAEKGEESLEAADVDEAFARGAISMEGGGERLECAARGVPPLLDGEYHQLDPLRFEEMELVPRLLERGGEAVKDILDELGLLGVLRVLALVLRDRGEQPQHSVRIGERPLVLGIPVE